MYKPTGLFFNRDNHKNTTHSCVNYYIIINTIYVIFIFSQRKQNKSPKMGDFICFTWNRTSFTTSIILLHST